MGGPAGRQRIMAAGANGREFSPHNGRDTERGRGRGRGSGPGQETPKDPLSPARLGLLKFPEPPQTAGIILPVMSLFVSLTGAVLIYCWILESEHRRTARMAVGG